jgi:hypothetical protein
MRHLSSMTPVLCETGLPLYGWLSLSNAMNALLYLSVVSVLITETPKNSVYHLMERSRSETCKQVVLVSNEVSVIIVFCFSQSMVSVYLLAILMRGKPVVLTGEVQLQKSQRR